MLKIKEVIAYSIPFFFFLFAIPTYAQLSVTTFPAEIKTGIMDTSTLFLTVKNIGQQKTSDIKVQFFHDMGAETLLENGNMLLDSLPKDAEKCWVVRTVLAPGFSESVVLFQIQYYIVPEKSANPLPGILNGSFKITRREKQKDENLFKIQIESTIAHINDREKGTIYLKLQNSSYDTLSINYVKQVSDTNTIKCMHTFHGIKIPPTNTHIQPVPIKIANRVRPGNHLLLLDVSVSGSETGTQFTRSVLVSDTLNVGVAGESDILKLLQIPSFFVLPGFLMVIVFILLWNNVFPKPASSIPLKPTDLYFWFFAITLSLLTTRVYPCFTNNNYLETYGLIDISNIWGYSILVSIIGWLLSVVIIKFVNSIKKHEEMKITPAIHDLPLTILEKLVANHHGFRPKHVKYNNCSYFVFPDKAEGENVFIFPQITYQIENANFKKDFIKAVNDPDENTLTLFEMIKKGYNKFLTLNWNEGKTALIVNKNDIKPMGGQISIFMDYEE